MSEQRFLLIGGVYKSATTSLYRYLADHPDICPAAIKETRFFLDVDYPVPSAYRYTDGLPAYHRLFPCHKGRICMEATPFYLYSQGTASRIFNALPSVQMVFVLREPISRLVSCYRYLVRDSVAAPYSFEAFVESLACGVQEQPEMHNSNQLAMGRYSDYLPVWFETFPAGAISVQFFEELVSDPCGVVSDVCSVAGIDASLYENYVFGEFNTSQRSTLPYVGRLVIPFDRLRIWMSRYTIKTPAIHRVLRGVKHRLEARLDRLTSVPVKSVTPAPTTIEFLRSYYAGEAQRLADLIGQEVPWDTRGDL